MQLICGRFLVMVMIVSFFISTTKSLSIRSPALRVIKPRSTSIALKMSSSSSSQNKFKISNRTMQTLDPCVILMKQIISQHEDKWKDDGIFSLAQGVVHWKPPKTAYEALANAAQANLDENMATAAGDGAIIHTYCPDEGYPPLIASLKDKLEQQNGLQSPHVMVTSGANQAYVNCVITLMDEVDNDSNHEKEPPQEMISKCVVFEPYYFNHVMAIQGVRGGNNCGGIASTDDSKSHAEGLLVGPTQQGKPDLTWLRSRLEEYKKPSGSNGIRMVTLVNPGNPTGVSLSHAFLKEIAQLTKEYGVWLIMDCTYEHFDIHRNNRDVENPNIPYPCLDQEHIIHIFSFSKGYAMAGFRTGYLAFSSKNGSEGKGTLAYEQMLKTQDTIAICTSRISQMAALGALQAGREWVNDQVKTLEVGRNAILEAMSSLEEIIGGTGAMYVMGKLPDSTDDKQFASSLVEHFGVAVIPGSFCGYPGWIRVCYSNLPPELCLEAASRLKRGILELSKK
mmetsp:Transcript_14448/g.22289  ORF Transcript_14448/g.22289 Transcript_14448/m.22289 type:complete len:508 (-) Transcript_14448:1168-2691(-)